MNRPNILVVMTDHQRADTVLPEHPAVTQNDNAINGYITTGLAPWGPAEGFRDD